MNDIDAARAAFLAGVAAFEEGQLEVAEAHFEASLAAQPGRPSTLANLGVVRLRLGRPAQALAALDAVLAQQRDSHDALLHRGLALAELGRLDESVQSLDRLLALDPRQAFAWGRRGAMLKDLGRSAEAAQSLARAIELGDDPELNRFLLASIEGDDDMPSTPPQHYVEGLFDSYAANFDEHLEQLGYRAPAQLLALLPPGERFGDVLDLGCGSGLAAPLWAPRCTALDGVDLSSRMLERAGSRGLYRKLHQAEAVAHLAQLQPRYALILAADMFIYVGALEALFAAARRALGPGGRLVFTAEEAPAGHDLLLATSTRYLHSEAYLRRLAGAQGFEVTALQRAPLRRDQCSWIGGLFVVLVKT